jgi:hypothetical protein
LGEIALTRSKETKREKQKRTKEKRDQTMKKMAGKLIQEDEEQGKQTKEVLLKLTFFPGFYSLWFGYDF